MTTRISPRPPLINRLTVVSLLSGALAGCGGGGGSGSTTDGGTPLAPAAATGATVKGVATKGPLNGALVTAYPVSDAGVVGSTELGHATTDASGGFSVFVGGYAGTAQLVVTALGATTTADEASGTTVPLPQGFAMHANAVVAASTGNTTQTAAITPYTELAHQIALQAGGLTPANVANANGVVFALIGVDPVVTIPVASNVAPGADATEAQKRYGLFNAAVSRLANSPPRTADATSVACLSAAGSDLGKKIDCAVRQIAGAVSVTGSGAQAVAAVNNKMAGLADALVAASADTAANKTGMALAATNSAVRVLESLEGAAASGQPATVDGNASAAVRSDVATAKAFFSALRANAAAVQSDAVSTGITDGVKAFGDSLRGNPSVVTHHTLETIDMARAALKLWKDFQSGATTNPNYASAPRAIFSPVGCSIYQGDVPTAYGKGNGIGVPYISTGTLATTPANARYVGCAVRTSPLPRDGTKRYIRTFIMNMSSDPTLSVVPYIAVTRAEFVQNGSTYVELMTPTLRGTFSITIADEEVTAFSLVGDLPPEATRDGTLRAANYSVNVAGSLAPSNGDVAKLSFAHGVFGVVPVGASAPDLVVDLSVNGASYAMIPDRLADDTDLAARSFNLAASISDAKGVMTGTLLADQFSRNDDGDIVVGHAKFTGSLSVAPVINGVASPVVKFFDGSLEATNGTTPVVSFSGALALPNRPGLKLTGSATEKTSDVYDLEARYVQNGLTVDITGSKKPGSLDLSFADSTGVAAAISDGLTKYNVTVGGRQTAVIDRSAKTITYSDGTFESLL